MFAYLDDVMECRCVDILLNSAPPTTFSMTKPVLTLGSVPEALASKGASITTNTFMVDVERCRLSSTGHDYFGGVGLAGSAGVTMYANTVRGCSEKFEGQRCTMAYWEGQGSNVTVDATNVGWDSLRGSWSELVVK